MESTPTKYTRALESGGKWNCYDNKWIRICTYCIMIGYDTHTHAHRAHVLAEQMFNSEMSTYERSELPQFIYVVDSFSYQNKLMHSIYA